MFLLNYIAYILNDPLRLITKSTTNETTNNKYNNSIITNSLFPSLKALYKTNPWELKPPAPTNEKHTTNIKPPKPRTKPLQVTFKTEEKLKTYKLITIIPPVNTKTINLKPHILIL